ncbi:hypothetical protein C8R43DRAFT_1112561 [Mycena crocata]|nr:hypothetical protein C8R43DRAFT_1112561 [Mycena crocata]
MSGIECIRRWKADGPPQRQSVAYHWRQTARIEQRFQYIPLHYLFHSTNSSLIPPLEPKSAPPMLTLDRLGSQTLQRFYYAKSRLHRRLQIPARRCGLGHLWRARRIKLELGNEMTSGPSTLRSSSSMRFTFVVLASAFVAVSATPVKEETYLLGWEIVEAPTSPSMTQTLASRNTPGGVKICTDINWGGTCGYAVQPLNTCIVLTSPWYHAISSFGPDHGAACFAYSQNNCDEANWEFVFPGDATGGIFTHNSWNDQAGDISSGP